MKIIDFKNFEPFRKIRKSLKISDDEIADFEGYKMTLEELNWEKIKSEGLDVEISELSICSDGTLEHKDYPGQKMIVYIRDWKTYTKNRYEPSSPKFHVSWCTTLKQMKEKNRYSRYVVSQRKDGVFPVNRILDGVPQGRSDEKLVLCKNCLSKIRKIGFEAPSNANIAVEKFNISDFLEQFNTKISITPRYTSENQPTNVYPDNWNEISWNYRKFKNWKCEECGKEMINDKGNLHVHHINGNTFDTNPSNLEAICID